MTGIIQYADVGYLFEPAVFMQTLELFQRERQFGWDYDSLHLTRRIEFPWVETQLSPQREDTILEAGSGKTMFGFNLAFKTKKVVCVDLDLGSISFLNNKYGSLKDQLPLGEFSAQIGDILKLNFKDEYFDKVCCISTLEHLTHWEVYPAINELLRVTKHGGKVVITMDVTTEASDFSFANVNAVVNQYGLKWRGPSTKAIFHADEVKFAILLIRIDKE